MNPPKKGKEDRLRSARHLLEVTLMREKEKYGKEKFQTKTQILTPVNIEERMEELQIR